MTLPLPTNYDSNNIFAKIIRKEIPANIVYENDFVLAFKDIAPKAPVHILVIPKNAYICYADFAEKASPEEIIAFTKSIPHIAREVGLAENGYRIISNIGKDSGQEVFHFHVHILGGKALPFS